LGFGLGSTTTKLLFKVLSPKGAGLKWESVGQIRPTSGHEVNNAQLADALTRKTEFSEEEWRALGIGKLYLCHFIRAGANYFSPKLDTLPTTYLGELEDICPNGFRLKLPPFSSADRSQSEGPEKEEQVYLLQHAEYLGNYNYNSEKKNNSNAEYLGNNDNTNNITNDLSLSLSRSLALSLSRSLAFALALALSLSRSLALALALALSLSLSRSRSLTLALSLSLSRSRSRSRSLSLARALSLGEAMSAPALAAAPRPAVPSGVFTGFISTRFS
jgi:hypothetical protein